MIPCEKCGNKKFKLKTMMGYDGKLKKDGTIDKEFTVEIMEWIKCAKCGFNMTHHTNGFEGIDFV